jgi:type VI protein secretion system component Hcp
VIDGGPPQAITIESLRYGTKASIKPGLTELVFTRPASAATTPLMLGRLQSQQAFAQATFTLTRAGLPAPLQTVTLLDVTVTAVQLTGSGADLSETVFLRFNRLERVTNIFAVNGLLTGSSRLKWNVATGVVE